MVMSEKTQNSKNVDCLQITKSEIESWGIKVWRRNKFVSGAKLRAQKPTLLTHENWTW